MVQLQLDFIQATASKNFESRRKWEFNINKLLPNKGYEITNYVGNAKSKQIGFLFGPQEHLMAKNI